MNAFLIADHKSNYKYVDYIVMKDDYIAGNDRYIYIDGREIAFTFSDELFNNEQEGGIKCGQK